MNESSIDAQRFQSWVRDHGAAVYRAAYRVVRDESAAEDVTQQVFLAALEGRLDPDSEHALEARLRWLAVKTALFHLRSERRRRVREEVVAMNHAEETTDVMPIERREEQRLVARFVDALPEDLRLPVVLRFEQSLSFRRIGELCAIAEATAFERVQRGLERIKRELGHAGFAALVPVLPELLLRVPDSVAVPAALEAGLTSLLAPSALASTALQEATTTSVAAITTSSATIKTMLIAAALLLLGGGLYWSGWFGSDPVSAEPVVPVRSAIAQTLGSASDQEGAVIRRDVTTEQVETESFDAALTRAGKNAANTDVSKGFVHGRIVDERGDGIAALEVVIRSVENAGKAPRFEERALTDQEGNFEAAVPVGQQPAQYYTWSSHRAGLSARAAPEAFPVERAQRVALGTIVMAPSGDDVLGDAEILVCVRDDAGRGVAKAIVELRRPHTEDQGQMVYTDTDGNARFREHSLGLRHVRVVAATRGYAPREVALHTQRGRNDLEIELRRGLRLEGQLQGPAGEALTGVSVALRRDQRWCQEHPALDAEGRFAFTSLDGGEYCIVINGGRAWSDVHIDAVRASDRKLLIELKPLKETRSIGMHDAEIHGVIVDAESGAELTAIEHDVELFPMGETSREESIAREAMKWLTPFFGQTAQMDWGGAEQEQTPHFVLDGCAAGRYLLVVKRSGYAPCFYGPIELAERQILCDLRIEMAAGVGVSGRVLGAAGRPLSEALVFVAPESDAAHREVEARDRVLCEKGGQGYLTFGPYESCDAEGRFTLEHAAPEISARIWVLHRDYQPQSWPLRSSAHGVLIKDLDLEMREPRK